MCYIHGRCGYPLSDAENGRIDEMGSYNMRILLVEDERLLSNAICRLTEDAGYFTDAVYNGADALYYMEQAAYDLVVLDIMLPEIDGLQVLKRMRQKGWNTPVLMLTAKNTIPDKVSGLNAGADDYMTKPFHTEEFLARINALTRRKENIAVCRLSFMDLHLDLNSAILQCKERSVQLTKKEFEVARFLLSNSKMTVTKEQLIVNVWGPESDATENNVEAYISFLRKKLKYLKSQVAIRSVHKIGYRLEKSDDK